MRRPFLLALSLAFSTACATTTVLNTTTLSPAAKAEIKLKKGANDNAVGTLVAEHLAPAALLSPDRQVYSVWIRQTDSLPWVNMGQMQVGDSRSGEFLLQTPYDAFDVLVTAEAKSTAVSPSEFIVLRGRASL